MFHVPRALGSLCQLTGGAAVSLPKGLNIGVSVKQIQSWSEVSSFSIVEVYCLEGWKKDEAELRLKIQDDVILIVYVPP